MSAEDEEVTQMQLPPNAVAYNGVITPYSNEARPIKLNGRPIILTGRPIVMTDPSVAPDHDQVTLTGRDGMPLTSRDGTVLTGRITPEVKPDPADALRDLPDGQAYLVDEDGAFLVDDEGAFLVDESGAHTAEEFESPHGSIEDYTRTALRRTDPTPPGQAAVSDEDGAVLTDIAGNALAQSLAGRSTANSVVSNFMFEEAVYAPPPNTGEGSAASGPSGSSIEILRLEMLGRLDTLESLIREQSYTSPNRGHNNPPDLIKIEPLVTQSQLLEVIASIGEIRREGNNPSADKENVVRQASVFRRIAGLFRSGTGWAMFVAASGVVGNRADAAFVNHEHQIYAALMAAADAAATWAHQLPGLF